jgi:hypothetical protein
MKVSAVTINHDLFEPQDNKTHNSKYLIEKTFWNFNAGAGLIILFALFSIFTLIIVFILDVLAFDINVFPVLLAVMLSTATGITVLIVSHTVQKTKESLNIGE